MKTNNALWLILLFCGTQHHLVAMQDKTHAEVPRYETFDREDAVPEPTKSLFRLIQCGAGHPDIAQAIKDLVTLYDATCEAEDAEGYRPLHRAAAAGLDDAVRALLDLGAYVDAKTNAGQGVTALWLAIEQGHATTAALLAKRGARVTKRVKHLARRAQQ